MKKIFRFLFLSFIVLFISACNEKKIALDVNDLKNLLVELQNQTVMTVYETTDVTTKDNQFKTCFRTTNLSQNYVYSQFEYEEKESIISYQNNKFYCLKNQNLTTLSYLETTDIYSSIGISYLFTYENIEIKEDMATIKITNNEISEFSSLLKNINIEFENEYIYNPTTIIIDIYFTTEKINYINFNLSLLYGVYFKSIVRKIEFSTLPFEKQTLDIISSGTKYYTEISDKLDTYILEMQYEYGDAIFIESGDFDMLIDAGQYEDGANLKAFINEQCEDKILECLIVTHGHGDHLGGINAKALSGLSNIELIIDYGYSGYDAYYESLRRKYDGDYYSAYDCVNNLNGAYKIYYFNENLKLEILNTGQYIETNGKMPDGGNENDYSVVTKLTFGNNTYLYTGDIAGEYYEKNLMAEDIQDVTVYKAAHHGAVSHKSNTQSFLDYVNPEICVVSAAIIDSKNINAENQWHPTYSFLQRILKTPKISKNKNIYFNGTMGTIHLNDDGTNIPSVEGLGAKKGYYINGTLISGEENKKFTETKYYQYKYY